jgi:hypothetical protein
MHATIPGICEDAAMTLAVRLDGCCAIVDHVVAVSRATC